MPLKEIPVGELNKGMNAAVVSAATTSRYREGDFHSRYSVLNVLGRGRFAVVRKCMQKETGKYFAAKFIRKRKMGRDCREDILKEIHILEISKDHPRLIELYEVYETHGEVILVLEFAAGGELHPYCVAEEEDAFTECDVVRLLTQILEGVDYLHQQNIVHLDLKPQNILLTKGRPTLGDIKLIDFGVARWLHKEEEVRDIVGTPDYVAPEVLSYEPISIATDMWSVGVLAFVMLSGLSPFAGDTKQETYLNISQVNLDFPDEYFADVSPEATDLIRKLCVKEPQKRYTAKMCLNHPWILKFQDKCNSSLTVTEPIVMDNNNHKDQELLQTNNKHTVVHVPPSPNNNSTAQPLFQPRSEPSIQDDCELEHTNATNELAVCDVSQSHDFNANGEVGHELRSETHGKEALHQDGGSKSPMPSPLGTRRARSLNKENLPKEVKEAKRFCMQMSPQHQGEVVC